VAAYLTLVENGKRRFFSREAAAARPSRRARPRWERRIHRRAARWTHATAVSR
jgi:hypothetical protein